MVCPTQAILVGEAGDPESEAARIIAREPVTVRRPEKGTRPKLFYRGATQATLDPLAAARPAGDTFAWSEIPAAPGRSSPGTRAAGNSSAAAVLAYDIGAPGAVGLAGQPLHLDQGHRRREPTSWHCCWCSTGQLRLDEHAVVWAAPLIAAAFLAVTAGLLVWDLEHPDRFCYILTRPQWRSWLVRGGVVLAGYAAVLGLHLLGSMLGAARAAAGRGGRRAPARRDGRRLHGLPVRPGQGA